MTADQLVAISVSWAIIGCGWCAWDFGRRFLAEKAAARIADDRLRLQDERIDMIDSSLTSLVTERKKMAEDWLRKFVQLERDWQKLKENAEARYQGAVAQAEAGQVRGYHR